MNKVSIKEIAKVVNGATPSTKHPEYYNGDIIWITPKDLSDQRQKYIIKGERSITEQGYNSCSAEMIPANNILMSSRAPIGLLSINKVDCCTNQGFKSLVVNTEKCDVEYLYYYLKFHIKEIEALGSGTTFKEVSKVSMENYEISLPDMTTQKKVAHALCLLDDKIENNNKVIFELESLAKTIYDYWFLQFEFPNEDGKPYKSSGGKMVWNEELKREIPEGWNMCDIQDCCEIIDCLHSKKPEYKYDNENSYLLTLDNLTPDGNIDISKKYYISNRDFLKWTSKITVSENDFVVTNAGRAGDVCKIPAGVKCAIGRNITAIHPVEINPYYLRQYFKSGYFSQQVKKNLDCGSFFMSFNVKSIKVLKILMPKASIYNTYIDIIIPIIQTIESKIQENQELASLRDFLLPMLMNVQVTFKD